MIIIYRQEVRLIKLKDFSSTGIDSFSQETKQKSSVNQYLREIGSAATFDE